MLFSYPLILGTASEAPISFRLIFSVPRTPSQLQVHRGSIGLLPTQALYSGSAHAAARRIHTSTQIQEDSLAQADLDACVHRRHLSRSKPRSNTVQAPTVVVEAQAKLAQSCAADDVRGCTPSRRYFARRKKIILAVLSVMDVGNNENILVRIKQPMLMQHLICLQCQF